MYHTIQNAKHDSTDDADEDISNHLFCLLLDYVWSGTNDRLHLRAKRSGVRQVQARVGPPLCLFRDLFIGFYRVAFLTDGQRNNAGFIILFKVDVRINGFGEKFNLR